MPKPRPLVVWTLSVAVMIPCEALVFGQTAYPNKPIRIVAAAAGGGGDFPARLLAQELTTGFGQQVVVENRPGNVIIPAGIVAKAQPDGYTLLIFSGVVWLAPFLSSNVPYDPIKDFAPVTLAVNQPNILVVHPSLPVKAVQDLIALAKAKPAELNYASSGSGSSLQLAAELFKTMAGVDIVHVPYKGAGAALNDLIGQRVQLMFPTSSSVTSHVKSGRLRALAVTSTHPSALYPDMPVLAATLPGFESGSLYGVFVPAATPVIVVNRLNREIVAILNRADIKEKLFNVGLEVVASSPVQSAAAIKSDMVRMGKVINDAGIRAD